MEIHIFDYNAFKIHQKLMNIIPYITYVHPNGNTYSDIVFVTSYVLFNNKGHPLGAPLL